MENPRTKASAEAQEANPTFKSTLQEPAPRFLAHVVEHGLTHGRRTPEDFMRHFSSATIMEGLKNEPQLRANILVIATGVRMKVALKKTAASSGADLQIALDEHEADAETVVGLFDPDDRVRFLDNRALWAFVVEGDVWKVEAKKDPGAHAKAASHVCYIIERALEDRLLTHRDVVRGVTVNAMASYLPRSELPKIFETALELGNAKKPFVERNLLEAVSVATLTQYVPLPAIWHQVVVPFIAEPHGFVAKSEPVAARASASAAEVERPRAEGETAARAAAPDAERPASRAVVPPARGAAPPVVQGQMAAPPEDDTETDLDGGLDLEVDELLGSLGEESVAAAAEPSTKKPFRVPTPGRVDSVPPGA